MALVLRSEKGSPLTSNEVDGNFTFLKGLIDEFVAPAGVGVQNISVAGDKMTFHLTDGTTRGPFQIPTSTMSWKDEYVPGTAFKVLDIFTVEGDGVYMVLIDHTAPDPFDPLYAIGGEPAYQKIFGFDITPSSLVPVYHSPFDWQVDSGSSGAYIRMEAPGPADVILPFDEDEALPEGFTCAVRGAGTGPYAIRFRDLTTEEAGVTDHPVGVINVPTGFTTTLRDVGSSATLIKVGTNEWDLAGDLAT
jgi:hypothetical protein